ncbi:hypothetical protein M3Y95_00858200 [Aphelenchoides besseyi]|nr:hypothetical protein M3Y95_00858200 [Aphelenchoides besseyi]
MVVFCFSIEYYQLDSSRTLVLLGIGLNAILLYIIVYQCQSATNIKPMLVFSSIADIIQAVATVFFSPVILTTNGYFVVFNNGLFSFKFWFLNNFFCCIAVSAVVSGWNCSPLQFMGRLHLLKQALNYSGDSPHGTQLRLYVFGTLMACLLATGISLNFFSRSSNEFLNEATGVLKYSGLSVESYKSNGGNLQDLRTELYLSYLLAVSVVSNGVIVGCWIQKRQYLKEITRTTQVSSSTRRMQAELQRVFMALAITPLASNVIPVLIHLLTILCCINVPFISLLCSLAFTSSPLINPLTAMFFVRPYRRVVIYWFRLHRPTQQSAFPPGIALKTLPAMARIVIPPPAAMPRRITSHDEESAQQHSVDSREFQNEESILPNSITSEVIKEVQETQSKETEPKVDVPLNEEVENSRKRESEAASKIYTLSTF